MKEAIENLKVGDFFHKVRANNTPMRAVWIRGKYCRINKAYECCRFDDVNSYIYIKKGVRVMIADI